MANGRAGTPQTVKNPRLETGGIPTNKKSSPRTRTAAEKEADAVLTVQANGAAVSSARPSRRGRRVAPRMFISLFAPSGRRSWWWFTGRCRVCGYTAFGRVRAAELAVGTRRVSCGHRAYLTVARTYRSPDYRDGAA